MKCHPDRNPGDSQAEAKFKAVQEAYSVLNDESKRARYDQFGNVDGGNDSFGFRNSGFHEGSFSDIFDNIFGEFGDFFGGHAGPRAPRSAKGRDREVSLDLTLEEVAQGVSKIVRMPTVLECNYCRGSGRSARSETSICATCEGSGKIQTNRGSFILQRTCHDCRGEGYTTQSPCGHCKGKGYTTQSLKWSVNVPAGIEHNNLIRLQGKGDAGRNGGSAGDLYIRINQIPHPIFKRQENNILCEIPISITGAALGITVATPTLKGMSKVEIPAETQNGDIVTLKGEGIRNQRSGVTGDLLCRIFVETPINLKPQQKELLRKLECSIEEDDTEHSPKSSQTWLEKMKGIFHSL